MQQSQHKRLTLGVEVSIAVGVLLLIVGYAVWRYPGSISRGGATDVTVIYTVLLAYEAPRDVVVHNTLEATSSHLLVVPVLAFIAGVAGAWIAVFLPKFGYVARHRRQ